MLLFAGCGACAGTQRWQRWEEPALARRGVLPSRSRASGGRQPGILLHRATGHVSARQASTGTDPVLRCARQPKQYVQGRDGPSGTSSNVGAAIAGVLALGVVFAGLFAIKGSSSDRVVPGAGRRRRGRSPAQCL
jgi:hypothetical protein